MANDQVSTDPAKAAVEESRAKYNAAYSARKDYSPEPNRFLMMCLDRIAPPAPAPGRGTDPAAEIPGARSALEVGVGQGRNAVLLAQRGYRTTGIDRSEVGIRAVRQQCAELGLTIHADVVDAAEFEFGLECWDVIALMYFPPTATLIERIKAAVKSGGHIIIERFSQNKTGLTAEVEDGQRPSPLLRHFVDWHVMHYEHDVFRSDWHWSGESPTGPIVRLLARKP